MNARHPVNAENTMYAALMLGACMHHPAALGPGEMLEAEVIPLDARLGACALAFPGTPIALERALCVARAHGFCSESVTCVAERRFDTWSVKTVLSDGCDPAAPAGGEALAIDAETGALLGRGTWTADAFAACPGR